MGRPIGSVNRQKPFADALRVEIRAGNDARHLRAIARKTDRRRNQDWLGHVSITHTLSPARFKDFWR